MRRDKCRIASLEQENAQLRWFEQENAQLRWFEQENAQLRAELRGWMEWFQHLHQDQQRQQQQQHPQKQQYGHWQQLAENSTEQSKATPIDYSKWNNIDCSSEEEEEEAEGEEGGSNACWECGGEEEDKEEEAQDISEDDDYFVELLAAEEAVAWDIPSDLGVQPQDPGSDPGINADEGPEGPDEDEAKEDDDEKGEEGWDGVLERNRRRCLELLSRHQDSVREAFTLAEAAAGNDAMLVEAIRTVEETTAEQVQTFSATITHMRAEEFRDTRQLERLVNSWHDNLQSNIKRTIGTCQRSIAPVA